jgi:hypothetical protein
VPLDSFVVERIGRGWAGGAAVEGGPRLRGWQMKVQDGRPQRRAKGEQRQPKRKIVAHPRRIGGTTSAFPAKTRHSAGGRANHARRPSGLGRSRPGVLIVPTGRIAGDPDSFDPWTGGPTSFHRTSNIDNGRTIALLMRRLGVTISGATESDLQRGRDANPTHQ